MNRVRTLVVDDSASMRAIIIDKLQRDPRIEVVGQAVDAASARQAIKQLNPQVITLDIEMPAMNGLEFLEKIMRLRPTPVVMVSSLTRKGAALSVKAFELGAVDVVGKPTATEPDTFDDLAIRVVTAANARIRQRTATNGNATRQRAYAGTNGAVAADTKLIAIGASTGGVEALIEVIQPFPADCPPTVITQHMPPLFTSSLAARLNDYCDAEVTEATSGAQLLPGKVYLAPGGDRHLEVVDSSGLRCRLRPGPRVNGHCPSVDVMFHSAAKAAGAHAVGVILTGMGDDGAKGLLKMRDSGARTIGQDERTSTVYGMPKVAHDIGAVGQQLPLGEISEKILSSSAQLSR